MTAIKIIGSILCLAFCLALLFGTVSVVMAYRFNKSIGDVSSKLMDKGKQ
ncbi:MAG TPA: hypothetical protein VIY48_14345 [Candidatus Paceibacterota bacterium]